MPVSSSFGFSEAALSFALFPLLNNVCLLILLFWPEFFFFFSCLYLLFCIAHKTQDLLLVEYVENTAYV